jgi:hypothetical protein
MSGVIVGFHPPHYCRKATVAPNSSVFLPSLTADLLRFRRFRPVSRILQERPVLPHPRIRGPLLVDDQLLFCRPRAKNPSVFEGFDPFRSPRHGPRFSQCSFCDFPKIIDFGHLRRQYPFLFIMGRGKERKCSRGRAIASQSCKWAHSDNGPRASAPPRARSRLSWRATHVSRLIGLLGRADEAVKEWGRCFTLINRTFVVSTSARDR